METPIDLEKMRSIGVIGHRTKNRVREYRDETDGHRIKETTDELNNSTVEHDTKDDRVDAIIRPETVHMKAGVQ